MGSLAVRVGLDANVLIAGIRLPRWPHEVLRAALTWHSGTAFGLVLPEQVITEARRHLPHPAQQRALDYFLKEASAEVAPFPAADMVFRNLDLVRSRKDVPIATVLLMNGVDIFVTSDRDFTEDGATSERLRGRVRIMLPAVFLRDALGWESSQLEAIRSRTWQDVEATRWRPDVAP